MLVFELALLWASGGNQSFRLGSSSFPQSCGRCAQEDFLSIPGDVGIPMEAPSFLRYSRFLVSCLDLVILFLHLTVI
jgi:hypothetical protein